MSEENIATLVAMLQFLTEKVATLESGLAKLNEPEKVPETPAFKIKETRDAAGNLVFGQGTFRRQGADEAEREAKAKREELFNRHHAEILSGAQGSSGTGSLAGPKIKAPSPWDGKALSLDQWLFSTELFLMSYGIPLEGDTRAVVLAASNMQGPAFAYWRMYSQRAALGEVEQITKWGDFKTFLRNYFQTGDRAELARNKMRTLSQRGTVLAYNEHVMGLMIDLPNRDMLDLVNDYIRGLNEKIRFQVIMEKPNTIDWAMSTALLVESGVREATYYGGGKIQAWPNKAWSGPNNSAVKVSAAGVTDVEGRNCYHCGKPGHLKWNCPELSAAEKAELTRLWEQRKARPGIKAGKRHQKY